MIVLHHLTHTPEPFHLNPDLIATIEAKPDTVLTLTTGAKVLVDETPEEVVEAVRAWRIMVLAGAMDRGSVRTMR
jgi:flagellar protein FlbD